MATPVGDSNGGKFFAPAMVTTAPDAIVTPRMDQQPASATASHVPSGESEIAEGVMKPAVGPTPSVHSLPPPAIGDRTPPAMTLTKLPCVTYTAPSGAAATPNRSVRGEGSSSVGASAPGDAYARSPPFQ